MNPALNTDSDMLPQAAPRTAVEFPVSRQLYWLLRRELWENRSVWFWMIGAGVILLAGHLLATVGRGLSIDDLAERAEVLYKPPYFVAFVMMGVAMLVSVFYCLDVLYSERRERSILFWKSMPVSDRMTVFAVAAVPMIVIPLLSTAVTLAAQFGMLIFSSFALSASGLEVGVAWERAAFLQSAGATAFHMVGIHGLWYAPFYGWLLLVSAWAPRLPFLWAFLPPVVLAAAEKITFDTGHFARLVSHRFSGGPYGEFQASESSMHALGHIPLAEFLFSPGLWLGLAVTAGLLLLAARVRGEREPN
jgi:ABC-2 type transport system permease protein